MKIRNWERFQPTMKDRNVIWIKVYRAILEDYEWSHLTSDSKATLIELLLLASENNGVLPEIHKIAFRLRKDEAFINNQIALLSHWLQLDNNLITTCQQDVTLEKSREEKSKDISSSKDDVSAEESFNEFWLAYPKVDRKVGKKSCLAKWKNKKLHQKSSEIIKHVNEMKNTKQWKDGFVPAPLTYINQERWEDGNVPLEDKYAHLKGGI